MRRRVMVAGAVGVALGAASRTPYVRRMLHVARGRPMIYGVTISGGLQISGGSDLRVDSCTMTGAERSVTRGRRAALDLAAYEAGRGGLRG